VLEWKRRLSVPSAVAIVLIALLVCGGTALAVTGGVSDANRHPNVGILLETSGGTYCSGTLISPTVFLTAAHCAPDGSRVSVSFDPTYTSSSRLYSGTFQADQFGSGVVVFRRPIWGIAPAQLPTAGQLTTLPSNQQFTVVGYGQREWPIYLGPIRRAYAVTTFTSVSRTHLQLSNTGGSGGACFGDSGGPNFLGGGSTETNVVAAITSGGDPFCGYGYDAYRLDTPAAQAFLGQYVRLP
jgi:hypothetical protein